MCHCLCARGWCVTRIRRRKFRCHGRPLPLPGYRERTHTDRRALSRARRCTSRCTQSYDARARAHTPWRYVWEYIASVGNASRSTRLYYLRPYYKSHFAGHSSLSIVPTHFNFRPRCKFHHGVVPGEPLDAETRRLPYTITGDVWVRSVGESAGGSFRFNSLGEP